MKQFKVVLIATVGDERKVFEPHTGSTDGSVRHAAVGAANTLREESWTWAYRKEDVAGPYALVMEVTAGPHVKRFELKGDSSTAFEAVRKQGYVLADDVRAWAFAQPEPPDGRRRLFGLVGR